MIAAVLPFPDEVARAARLVDSIRPLTESIREEIEGALGHLMLVGDPPREPSAEEWEVIGRWVEGAVREYAADRDLEAEAAFRTLLPALADALREMGQ